MTPSEFGAALVNHLWQSTVVVGLAWLLAWALRKNHARVRYWVWFAASVKFLLPFSLLITAGEWIRSLLPAAAIARPAVTNAMERVTEPFAEMQILVGAPTTVVANHGNLLGMRPNWWLAALLGVWACGALMVLVRFVLGWFRVYAAKRAARTIELAADVPVLAIPALLEPGIFGIFRQVLLMPEGVLDRLSAEQIRAIVAHEMEHVRRRDNLTFAVHMLVETLFWFYPAMWCIGTRLIDERERACDEAVVASGGAAQTYAEGILNVCKFYLESPVACVAGVTGADLKRRIMRIMAEQIGRKLNLGRKLLLAAVGLLAVAAPIAAGLIYADHGLAQVRTESADAPPIHFEVASIKPDPLDRMTLHFEDDGVVCTSVPVAFLVQLAYGVEGDQILGLPAWAKTEGYRIEAKVDDADVPRWKAMKTEQRDTAFQSLLASRFGFKIHFDQSERKIYALVVAKNGPRLLAAIPADKFTTGMKRVDGSPLGRNTISATEGRITILGGKIDVLAKTLAYRGLGYPIEDRTGLTGNYDIALEWTPGNEKAPDDSGSSLSIFTALEEQLGLKLELEKGTVEMIVVDQVEKPSEN